MSSNSSKEPWINPACLPYKAQHMLLVRAQGILENSCFRYAVHSMPRVLENRRWVVPECVELNIWARIFKYETETRFKDEAIPHPHPSWDSFFQSIANLRHKAVHREQLTSSAIESYLRDAHNFARLLHDDEGAETLARFREETREYLGTFEVCRRNISRSFQAKMDEINTHRAELDIRERQAMQNWLQEDMTIHDKLGADLKEAVVNAEVVQAKEEKKGPDDHEESKMSTSTSRLVRKHIT
ncbi:ubiquinol-cytochrome-c reductase cytochrome c1 [Colletotrichum falcatum]|nr:ubiquinol-cytochrome-c reductase cytochrome c1 [Colletotrichum falcatum]